MGFIVTEFSWIARNLRENIPMIILSGKNCANFFLAWRSSPAFHGATFIRVYFRGWEMDLTHRSFLRSRWFAIQWSLRPFTNPHTQARSFFYSTAALLRLTSLFLPSNLTPSTPDRSRWTNLLASFLDNSACMAPRLSFVSAFLHAFIYPRECVFTYLQCWWCCRSRPHTNPKLRHFSLVSWEPWKLSRIFLIF